MIGIIGFIVGLLVGSCVSVTVLCCLQIHRINYYEREIRRLRRQIRTQEKEGDQDKNASVEGGE